jgi:beta-glucanase (GH16 family)
MMHKRLLAIGVVIVTLLLPGLILAQGGEPEVVSGAVVVPALIIDDFESGVPVGMDAVGNPIGLVAWGDAFENVTLSARQVAAYSALALPTAPDASNTVLAAAYDIGQWGGFTHALTDGETWISADWTAYNALSLWLHGSDTGGIVQVEIFDNRSPDSAGDSAERFFYRITDDYTGWRQYTIPFEAFQRRADWQPAGAPDDGLGLDAVSGYAVGLPAGVGAQTAYLDDVGLAVVEDTAVVMVAEMTGAADMVEVDDSITWDSREWALVWSDEFEGDAGTAIDADSWTCEIGGHGWGNNEMQYYTDRVENAALDGAGNLAIVARAENPEDYACHYGRCAFTSARCITMNKVEFTYGRVEARLQIPYGQGIWPAFWMLGADFPEVGWPDSGEIDIMENVGFEPQTVHSTLHGPGYSGANGIGAAYTIETDFADDFHVFAIDWDPDAIRWYVDGELVNILTPNDLNGRSWVYDHDFFLLLNVAVGGEWPGFPDETTEFPQTMLVDYVRVYTLAGE